MLKVLYRKINTPHNISKISASIFNEKRNNLITQVGIHKTQLKYKLEQKKY
jgi:hypothetical protein